MRASLWLLFLPLVLAACQSTVIGDEEPEIETTFVEPSAQRAGDPDAGYDYLVNGAYVGRGVPLEIVRQVPFFGTGGGDNVLGRTGDNADLPPDFTAVTAPNGVRVVAPNCLACHGQRLRGEYVVGLGNSLADFTTNSASVIPLLDLAVQAAYGADSPEWEAYRPFREATLAVGPHIVTDVAGMNPAIRLTFVLAAHRDPQTLAWSNEPRFALPEEPGTIVPTDVPAWWILKKKNAEFYTALGRGDFARISMAASLLTLRDTAEARAIDARFPDVVAYLKSIEPPPFPEAVDAALAAEGERVFEQNCSRCHGRYGADESYPNLLVALETVGTDPVLAEHYAAYAGLIDVYNNSWFGQGPHAARLDPGRGYVAPPLDGVWATAPYLHNGSVPTLAALLDSRTRPTRWRRSLDDMDYDLDAVGWNYTEPDDAADVRTYDTTRRAHGNQGHTFGDALTDAERRAVIEYLKTL